MLKFIIKISTTVGAPYFVISEPENRTNKTNSQDVSGLNSQKIFSDQIGLNFFASHTSAFFS